VEISGLPHQLSRWNIVTGQCPPPVHRCGLAVGVGSTVRDCDIIQDADFTDKKYKIKDPVDSGKAVSFILEHIMNK
jgi:hypothetical protein